MFTGIIQHIGIIKNLEKIIGAGKVTIAVSTQQSQDLDFNMEELFIGDSVAVDGVCITIVEKGKDFFTASVSEETFGLTTLSETKVGRKVNLEKALKPSDRFGGHIVTGHVDGIGVITKKDMRGGFAVMEFSIPQELIKYVVKKGSVAVDGISLTVADINDNGFTVHLIPHTLKSTALGSKNVGDKVNIETDIIGKYVERFLFPYTEIKGSSNIDTNFLIKHGFIDEE